MSTQIRTRRAGDVIIVDVEGRCTIGPDCEKLNAALREASGDGAVKLLINLAGAVQIDSSGLSALVRTFVTVGRAGGALKLLKPQGRVREVLQTTRLLEIIPYFDDEAEALASFQ